MCVEAPRSVVVSYKSNSELIEGLSCWLAGTQSPLNTWESGRSFSLLSLHTLGQLLSWTVCLHSPQPWDLVPVSLWVREQVHLPSASMEIGFHCRVIKRMLLRGKG